MWLDVNNEYFPLEQSHNYIVRLTLKVPSDGTYVVDMGSWEIQLHHVKYLLMQVMIFRCLMSDSLILPRM